MYFDGSNSPKFDRPSSWGYVLEIEGFDPIEGQGLAPEEQNGVKFPQTNNTGEYSGLIAGLKAAIQHGVTDLTVYGDSQLVVYQTTGKYRVNRTKNPHLGILWDEVQDLLKKFPKVAVQWKRQEHNKADSVSRVTKDKVGGMQYSTKSKGKITIH